MKLSMYKDEAQLEVPEGHSIAVGDVLPVYQGDGPREASVWALQPSSEIREDGSLGFYLEPEGM